MFWQSLTLNSRLTNNKHVFIFSWLLKAFRLAAEVQSIHLFHFSRGTTRPRRWPDTCCRSSSSPSSSTSQSSSPSLLWDPSYKKYQSTSNSFSFSKVRTEITEERDYKINSFMDFRFMTSGSQMPFLTSFISSSLFNSHDIFSFSPSYHNWIGSSLYSSFPQL